MATSEARTNEEMGWAVWIGDRRNNHCVAVLAESQDDAERKALEESDGVEIYHVDGPFQNSEPAVWEFEFITEHRERVVVEAPYEDYAKESADAERDYRGEYVQTVHTEKRRIPKEDLEDAEE